MEVKMKQVALSNAERIHLNDIISTIKGNYTLLKDVRELQEELSFTNEEKVEFGIEISETNISWQKDPGREFSIVEPLFDKITSIFTSLDRENLLEQKHLSLYEKFVL